MKIEGDLFTIHTTYQGSTRPVIHCYGLWNHRANAQKVLQRMRREHDNPNIEFKLIKVLPAS